MTSGDPKIQVKEKFVAAGVEVAFGEEDWIQMMCPSNLVLQTTEITSMPKFILTTKSKSKGETFHTHTHKEWTGTCESRQSKSKRRT